MIRSPLIVLAMLLAIPAQAGPPLAGIWGGDQSVLTLRADGGSFESGCSYAEWNAPAAPDASGRFVVRGRLQGRAAGSQRDGATAGASAEFSGQIHDDLLVLSIRGDGPPREVTLKRGVRSRMVRCL